jgi:hypothetical protein
MNLCNPNRNERKHRQHDRYPSPGRAELQELDHQDSSPFSSNEEIFHIRQR